MRTDFKNNFLFGTAGAFPTTTDGSGYAFDLSRLPSATLCISTGTVTLLDGAGATITIEHSDELATGYTTCDADDLIGGAIVLTAATWSLSDAPVGKIGYRGGKQYIRAVVTKDGSTDATIVGTWIFYNLDIIPAGRRFMPDEDTFTPAIDSAFTGIYLSSDQIVV